MNISKNGLDLIKKFEGWSARPYPDPGTGAEPYTIGYGSIMHPDGRKVKMTDPPLTKEQGEQYLRWEIKQKEAAVSNLVKPRINQNQFDALMSFTYNLGVGALAKSTLLKKVNANPSDPAIRDEFQKWVNAGGKPLAGLIRRRKAEADLYFS